MLTSVSTQQYLQPITFIKVKDFRICGYLEFAHRNLEIFALVKVACRNNCGIKLELLRRYPASLFFGSCPKFRDRILVPKRWSRTKEERRWITIEKLQLRISTPAEAPQITQNCGIFLVTRITHDALVAKECIFFRLVCFLEASSFRRNFS
jgi:hypothetical protein